VPDNPTINPESLVMFKPMLAFLFFFLIADISRAEGHSSKASDKCGGYANASRHQCLEKQLAISTAELDASVFAVKKMMAQWGDAPNRRLAEANFEATIGEFERYKRLQCEYFASMRYGLGDKDEIEIQRLECELHMNAQRTRLFEDLTRTTVM
jgi:hypothetical protein